MITYYSIGFLLHRATIVLSLLLITSCDKICDISCDVKDGPGAIVLTFDDKYINNWYKADSILSQYNWKATFCVTKYATLTEDEKQKLLSLQRKGHEIASHGAEHLNALEYLSNHSINEYIDEEILPSINKMRNDSLIITSFAYPGGVRSVELDLALYEYFSVLRGTMYDRSNLINQSCFLIYGSDEVLVKGLGIDSHYEHFNIDHIMDLVKYAEEEKIALILYGHNISDNGSTDYVTTYETIERICTYASNNNLEFLTLNDLISYNLK